MHAKESSASANNPRERQQAHRLYYSYEESVEQALLDQSQFNGSSVAPAEYYFQHAKRLYLDNLALARHLEIVEQSKIDLESELKKYESLAAAKYLNESAPVNEEKKRRKRRNASEIERLYRCRAEGCGKSYGSEGTLSQHLKLKHHELFVQLYGDAEERNQAQQQEPDRSQQGGQLDSEPSKAKSDHQES